MFRPSRTRSLFAIGTIGAALSLIFIVGASAGTAGPGGVASSGPGGVASSASPPIAVNSSLALRKSLNLVTPNGTIRAVVYDGNQKLANSSLTTSLGGFTVPAAPFTAKTTYVVFDGQCGPAAPNGCAGRQTLGSGDTLSFSGSAGTVSDGPDAFKGSDGCPWGSDTCLWDTRTFDVSSTLTPGDTSASATVTAGNIGDGEDCINPEVQVFAVGPTAAWAGAGYIAAGTGLRNQGSGTIAIAGLPPSAFIVEADLYWAILGSSDPGGAMMINGKSAPGTLVAADGDPCWSNPSSFAYRADVTPHVVGNGTYTISGYPTGSTSGLNPWDNPSPAPMMEGASLIVFFVPDPQITATGTTFSATEGAPFSGTVATFTDPDPSATASEYAATIDWGDATSSPGTISGPTGGPFTVTGGHTYTEEGSYTVKVTVTDIDNPSNTATATSKANVADAPIAATCAASPVSPLAFSGPVANLTDANPFGTTADFTATINWGDASSSAGTVSGPTGGPYTVSGSHTYSTPGTFTITTTITDDGGSTATTSCVVLVFATSAGGNFVIGDGNSAVGTPVTFWGAQWAKRNTLSGGPAPAAFKGFENKPSSAPACGTSWSTRPGNSPPPPAGPLPAFMAVIVSSSISKSGSTISGNTPHVVVVQTNPGYGPNPGHAGTGKVVAVVC